MRNVICSYHREEYVRVDLELKLARFIPFGYLSSINILLHIFELPYNEIGQSLAFILELDDFHTHKDVLIIFSKGEEIQSYNGHCIYL